MLAFSYAVPVTRYKHCIPAFFLFLTFEFHFLGLGFRFLLQVLLSAISIFPIDALIPSIPF